MSNRLHILIALPRPIVTLLAEENGAAVAVSSWDRASGVARVPPLRETPKLDAVRAALRDRPARLTLLRHATVENLQAALRDRPHVFIVDTHGDEDGALLFEGPCGETNALPAAELGALLARREVGLAVLSACHSAAAAGALRAAGLPLVIGMAESIYEDAAAAYLAALLGALATGDAPHAAHQAGLARLRSRFGRREGEAGLPQLFHADYAALRPLVADLAGDFEEAAPLPPTPEPPPPLARLFGRELDQVWFHRLLLQSAGRLATLSGMGGIGKTALARAVACWAWQRNLFPGGVFFASLETLTSGETVAARLAGQLDPAPGEGMTHQDALAAALGGPAPTLLVADNCETAAGAAEDGLEVLTDLRRRCPRLRVLATGRRALGLEGEGVHELPPLPLPDAVALFLDRAGRSEKEAGRRTVEAICRKLDCVPLHLELVASHKAATPAEILEGLDDTARARHLTAAPSTGSGQARPDLPERQRSQLLSFYYTWERLSAAGQKTWAAFAALFASGAAAAALRAVAGDAWPADAGLEEAVAWHVLRRWETAGRSRYGMLATVADFGRDRAAESDLDLPALRRRHAEYYLAVARRFKETPMEAWRTLEPEMDNVAAGFETAIAGLEAALGAPLDELAADSLAMNRQAKRPKPAKAGSFRALYRPLVSLARRLIARRPSGKTTDERPQSESTESLAGEYARALYNYVFRRRPPQSGRWLRAGLAAWAAAGDRQRVGLFCNQLGLFCKARGEYDAALEWYMKDLAISEELGDQAGLATTYNNIAVIHYARGDYDAALAWYDKSVAINEALGNKAVLATTYNNIGLIHDARGEYDAALAWYDKSVALKEELGDQAGLATTYNNIAVIHYARGDYDAALAWYDKSVTITEELGDQAGLAASYNNIATIHYARGDDDAALAWYDKSVALEEELGDKAGLATSYNNIGLIHQARGDYAAALEWYDKSLFIKEALGDKPGLATSYNNIGEVHRVRGDYDAALEWHAKSLAIREELGDKAGLATSYNNIGLIHEARGDYDAALEWHAKSLAIREELGDKAGLATSYNNIATIHYARGDYDAALAWYAKSVALKEALGDKAGLATSYNNIGNIYQARGDYDAALAWYDKSVAINEALGNKAVLATSYNNIGLIHDARGDYDAALEWYDKSVALKEELGNKAGLAASYNNIGEVHRVWGDDDAALEWYGKSVALEEELGNRAGLATSYNNIGLIYDARGDDDAALAWYAKSVTIMEELGDKAGLAASYNNIAFIHWARGELAQAIALFERSLAILEAIGARATAETVRRNLERARAGL